ncbi:MAG: MmcQ/YjbR family DNA-binding protein [Devosia sp.]|uniref:MmcQ/YjbR family DNA-binding protein n=1 Tax=Devosia sp. TaxID=1871048 RepID=UPI0024C9BA5C|nr:MmcQ/YjbR family DNA-binding protein [Devosia sp.]UYN98419.1 MAG: MmcQ/YjbR family DNA-binding protein [Devosia sp.]
MSLFLRPGFDDALAALPGVSFVDQWDARVAKVGGKVFCLLSDTAPHRIVLKCGETSFDILSEIEGVEQAAYFAKRQWVSIEPGALPEGDVLAYATRSHELVAAGLTKKLRAELGIA